MVRTSKIEVLSGLKSLMWWTIWWRGGSGGWGAVSLLCVFSERERTY